MRNLIEYINAMEIVQEYENSLKPPEGEGAGICRCQNCKLKFGFVHKKDVKREEDKNGIYWYYGVCPYCNKETLLDKY